MTTFAAAPFGRSSLTTTSSRCGSPSASQIRAPRRCITPPRGRRSLVVYDGSDDERGMMSGRAGRESARPSARWRGGGATVADRLWGGRRGRMGAGHSEPDDREHTEPDAGAVDAGRRWWRDGRGAVEGERSGRAGDGRGGAGDGSGSRTAGTDRS